MGCVNAGHPAFTYLQHYLQTTTACCICVPLTHADLCGSAGIGCLVLCLASAWPCLWSGHVELEESSPHSHCDFKASWVKTVAGARNGRLQLGSPGPSGPRPFSSQHCRHLMQPQSHHLPACPRVDSVGHLEPPPGAVRVAYIFCNLSPISRLPACPAGGWLWPSQSTCWPCT